jgi:hypothetical protein
VAEAVRLRPVVFDVCLPLSGFFALHVAVHAHSATLLASVKSTHWFSTRLPLSGLTYSIQVSR